jgi:hypothetical protein
MKTRSNADDRTKTPLLSSYEPLATECILSYTYGSYLQECVHTHSQVHIQCTSPNSLLRVSAGLFTLQ